MFTDCTKFDFLVGKQAGTTTVALANTIAGLFVVLGIAQCVDIVLAARRRRRIEQQLATRIARQTALVNGTVRAVEIAKNLRQRQLRRRLWRFGRVLEQQLAEIADSSSTANALKTSGRRRHRRSSSRRSVKRRNVATTRARQRRRVAKRRDTRINARRKNTLECARLAIANLLEKTTTIALVDTRTSVFAFVRENQKKKLFLFFQK